MGRTTYECWKTADGSDTTFADKANVEKLKSNGLIPSDAILEYAIEALTSEEASAIHHLRQGFEPYVPMGKAGSCPKCESIFYPESSGDCWRCVSDS